jgi:hypothetical protein
MPNRRRNRLPRAARSGSGAATLSPPSPPAPSRGRQAGPLPQIAALESGRHVTTDSILRHLLPGMELATVPRGPGREPEFIRLIQILSNLDPDASAAITAAVRLANSGHSVDCEDSAGNPLPEAAARLRLLEARVWHDGGGGADVLVDTLIKTLIRAGGAGIDIVVTPDLWDVRDFYPYTPLDIVFKYEPDPATGDPVLRKFPANSLYGAPLAESESLPDLQTPYQPLDPDPDDPYGIPPFLAAVSALLQLIDLLRDIQEWARVHGYGQRDVKILKDALVRAAPEDYLREGNELQLATWIRARFNEIRQDLENVDPNKTFVHTDDVEVSTTMPGGQGYNADGLIAELARRVRTGLKTPPPLMGQAEGTTTLATVQWSVYARTLVAIQLRIRRLLEAAYNTVLRIWGVPGLAKVTFESIRATDRVIDATAEATEIANAENLLADGVIDHNEFAQLLAGHAPRGPRPPNKAEEFRLAVAQAQAQTAAALAGLTVPNAANGFPPITVDATNPPPEDAPPALPPGSDAGLTEAEGAALDGNLPDQANARAAGGGDGTAPSDLGEDAAAILGSDVVEETRRLLRILNAAEILDLLEAAPAEEAAADAGRDGR